MRCGLLLQFVCVLGTRASRVKVGEPIEMPLVTQSCWPKEPYIRWGCDPPWGKDNLGLSWKQCSRVRILRFFSKSKEKHDFLRLRFFELLHTFYRTVPGSLRNGV